LAVHILSLALKGRTKGDGSMTDRALMLKGQGMALRVTTVAFAGRFALDPRGDFHPYVTFFVAVAFTTWYAGMAAALTATLLGGLTTLWFFIPPRLTLEISVLSQQVGLATYAAVSLTFIAFGHVMHRAQQRAEELNAMSIRMIAT
jgi:K+-sensing histidine kinase KdpD